MGLVDMDKMQNKTPKADITLANNALNWESVGNFWTKIDYWSELKIERKTQIQNLGWAW